jgi:FKBP-type peptidyl-prolyl cis-trans isomerase
MLRRFTKIASLSMVLIVAGCLESSSGPGQAIAIEDTSFASSLNVDLNASTKTINGMYYRDLTVGTGAVVMNGQSLDVRYTGWLSSGFQFDSNVDRPAPLTFTLGTGNVIQGWHEGLQGARVGTRRQLIIPAYLGYGPGGNGPIPGNAVIVFVVEIVAAR